MNAMPNLQTIRKALEDKRAELMERICQVAGSSQKVGSSPDPCDLAQALTSNGVQSALIARTERHLEKVESALQCLDEGTYGMCLICDKAIARERLNVLPYAVTCLNCQQQQEQVVRGIDGRQIVAARVRRAIRPTGDARRARL